MGQWAAVGVSIIVITGLSCEYVLVIMSFWLIYINGNRYLKCIDRFYNNFVSCFITGGSKSSLSFHPTSLFLPLFPLEIIFQAANFLNRY